MAEMNHKTTIPHGVDGYRVVVRFATGRRIGSPNGIFPHRCHRLPLAHLGWRPRLARSASGFPGTPRRPAKATRSKAWHGSARSG
jgi:hypothetical protein